MNINSKQDLDNYIYRELTERKGGMVKALYFGIKLYENLCSLNVFTFTNEQCFYLDVPVWIVIDEPYHIDVSFSGFQQAAYRPDRGCFGKHGSIY